MTTRIPLETAKSAEFFVHPDGITRAQLEIGPDRARINWHIERVTTQVSGNQGKQSDLRIYKNSVTPSRLVTSTYTADSNADDAVNLDVRAQEKLIAVWTGADVGAIATLIVLGEIEY